MKKLMQNWCKRIGLVSLLAALAVFIGTGCENGSGDDGGDGGRSHVGTWALYPGTAVLGTIDSYIRFKGNGTYTISDNADGTGERVSGTWTRSGDAITGPFTNPGVGNGRIDCVLNSDVLVMDFIEYWQTPHRLVPYAGTQL